MMVNSDPARSTPVPVAYLKPARERQAAEPGGVTVWQEGRTFRHFPSAPSERSRRRAAQEDIMKLWTLAVAAAWPPSP
jgi:hypothetical protein